MSVSKKVSVRVELENEYVDMLELLKQERMFTTNTDVIRYCLHEMTQAHNFRIEEEHVKLIKNILQQEDAKKQYSLFSVSDFIKKAIDEFLDHIKTHTTSIQNWDVRSTLTEEEIEVALALIECQTENVSQEVKLQEILSKLDRKNQEHVQKILDDFIRRGILSSRKHGKEIFYHAKK